MDLLRERSKAGLVVSITSEDELAMTVSFRKNCLPKTW